MGKETHDLINSLIKDNLKIILLPTAHMNNLIGLKEFRENLGEYEKLVQKGRSFVVMKRSKPIFTIGPVDDGEWETVIDFTKFRKNGIPINELIERLKKLN